MDMMSYLMGRNSGGAKKGAKIEVVTELPETGESNVIYLVPKQDEDENNVFDEYLYVNNEWELIGTTDIDLSNYYTKSEIDGKLPPIYVLNTTDDLSDGDKSFGNNEKNQFSTIITDAYAKGFKGIVVLLISTTSGRTYVFYSSNQITNRSFPELVTDYSQSNRGIQMQKVYIRRLYTVGSWNNDVFTCSSLDCSSVRANLLTSDNVTAYNVSNNYTPAHKKYVDDAIAGVGGQTIQYETMPTAGAGYVGKIVQYTGTTDANYTNGYFYVCVGTTENDVTTYSWSNVEVQASDGIIIFKDDGNNYSSSSVMNTDYNKSKLKELAQAYDKGKNPIVIFILKTFDSISGGTYPFYTDYAIYKNSNTFSFQFNTEVKAADNNDTAFNVTYNKGITMRYVASYKESTDRASFSSRTIQNNLLIYDNRYQYPLKMPVSLEYIATTILQLSTYSSSKTYQEGDYVYNVGSGNIILYRCNTSGTTGPWDSSKWDEKTYMEYLSDTLVGGALNGSY